MCKFEGCLRAGRYNYVSKKGGAYCINHLSMLTTEYQFQNNPLCSTLNCDNYANYNYIKGTPIFCFDHATNGMVHKSGDKVKGESMKRTSRNTKNKHNNKIVWNVNNEYLSKIIKPDVTDLQIMAVGILYSMSRL